VFFNGDLSKANAFYLFSKSAGISTENAKQLLASHWTLQYMSFQFYIPLEVGGVVAGDWKVWQWTRTLV